MPADPTAPEAILERRGEVGVLTLNRPRVRNPLTHTLTDVLLGLLDEAERDDGLRALVLTGAGSAFCSGAELGKLVHPDGVDPEWQYRAVRGHNRLVQRLRDIDLPVIAAVNGPAIGGGAALAVCCDLAVAADEASCHFAFGRIGLSSADMGLSYHLPRKVGSALATYWLLTGATIGAAEGKAAGLYLDVVPRAQLLDRAVEVGRQIAAAAPRRATALSKLSIARGLDSDLPNVLSYEAYAQNFMFQRGEHKDLLRALMQQLKQR